MAAALDDHSPDEIFCNSDVFDIDFHPAADIVALGTISGVVQVYKYSEEANTQVLELKHHLDAVRGVLFAPDGQTLYTASADKSIRAFDTLGNVSWAELRAHEWDLFSSSLVWVGVVWWRGTNYHLVSASNFVPSNAVNQLHELSPNVFSSGDDMGCVKIWDTRQHRCLAEFKEHTDFISGFATNPARDHLLATSGDGRLSVYDLRKNVLAGKSDELDDELLSVSVIKNGRKVVCGSQDGVLVIFSWGTWGDMSDRFPGHPDSVESVLKVDEDTILTGSSDGIIRVVQVHPNKLLGLIGDHEDFPVEVLKFSHDKKLVGSVSHTNKVHFWDVGYLFDEDDGDDDDEDVEGDADELEMKPAAAATEDAEMQDADSDDSDSDSDDYSGGGGGAASGRRVLPTANETFFSDL